MKSLKWVFIIALAAVVTSCGASRTTTSQCKECGECVNGGESEAVKLEGSQWKLLSLNGEALGEGVALDADSFSLTFAAEGLLGGVGACNRIIGQYEVLDSERIEIEVSGVTMMFCPNLEVESAYVEALKSVTRFQFKGGQLSLYNGDKALLTFEES